MNVLHVFLKCSEAKVITLDSNEYCLWSNLLDNELVTQRIILNIM